MTSLFLNQFRSVPDYSLYVLNREVMLAAHFLKSRAAGESSQNTRHRHARAANDRLVALHFQLDHYPVVHGFALGTNHGPVQGPISFAVPCRTAPSRHAHDGCWFSCGLRSAQTLLS